MFKADILPAQQSAFSPSVFYVSPVAEKGVRVVRIADARYGVCT